MTVFLKNEYGKEKTDQEIDDAALTNLKNIKPLVVVLENGLSSRLSLL